MATLQLTITDAEVLRLCRLDPGDTQAAADASEILTREQEALEATLRPDALADLGLTALLRRNVAKLLASALLAMRSREDGVASSFKGAGLELSAPPPHAAHLRGEAEAALAPYLRVPAPYRAAPTLLPNVPMPTGETLQASLFGPDEMNRLYRRLQHWEC